jgi:hypothetical protein
MTPQGIDKKQVMHTEPGYSREEWQTCQWDRGDGQKKVGKMKIIVDIQILNC